MALITSGCVPVSAVRFGLEPADGPAGEPWLTAATPVENPYCSCGLTRVRYALQAQDRAHRIGQKKPVKGGSWLTAAAIPMENPTAAVS